MRISQDHVKLGSDTIAQCIEPLVGSDLSFKVKAMIVEIQSLFGYTISYRKSMDNKTKGNRKSLRWLGSII